MILRAFISMQNWNMKRAGDISGREGSMQDKKRKIFTPQMLKFEMLNVLCNPYTHIFGVGLPILLAMLITKVAVSQLPAEELHPMVATSVYLGMGTLVQGDTGADAFIWD